jgi:hypothetical protein
MIIGFIKKNSVMIVSLILGYAIVNSTIQYWPEWIYWLSGKKVDWDLSKYRFPIVIVALLIYPILSWLKKQFVTSGE